MTDTDTSREVKGPLCGTYTYLAIPIPSYHQLLALRKLYAACQLPYRPRA